MKIYLPFFGLLLALSGALAIAPFYSDVKNPIDNEYVVVLHSNTTTQQQESLLSLVEDYQGEILAKFSTVLKGFGARMSEKTLQMLLEQSDVVKYIERNMEVGLSDCIVDSGPNVPWGLSRINHEQIPIVNSYSYNPENGGDGHDQVVYVIDTGIQTTHQEFEPSMEMPGMMGVSRAEFGVSFIPGETDSDCNGHGTHVAGSIGGNNVGVAKAITLVSVKVLNCTGYGSSIGVLGGIDWAAYNCKFVRNKNKCVANLSLGGGFSVVQNAAVNNAVDNFGVAMVVAAGNENVDACDRSPASAEKAITVGATFINGSGSTYWDERAGFSNYGSCVDIFAPGVMALSAFIDDEMVPGNNCEYAELSGTSMASPLTAGVVAQMMANPDMNKDIPASGYKNAIECQGMENLIEMACPSGPAGTNCEDSPNKLLQSVFCTD